jgi:signal transduction histidine kinase
MQKLLGGILPDHVDSSTNVLGPSAEILQRWMSNDYADSALRAESTVRSRDGANCLVSMACCRLALAGRLSLVCVFRDISAQRRVERVLAGTTGRDVLQAASSLHEDLAQRLAGVSLQLGSLARGLNGSDTSANESVRTASDQLSDAIRVARRSTRLLSPMTAVSGVLGNALRALADSATAQFGIPVRYTETDGCVVSGVIADQLFRITQNALTYAFERSDGDNIGLQLGGTGRMATVTVSWAGRQSGNGEAPAPVLDLEVIHHRARPLGGTCELRAGTAGRWSILVIMPLQDEDV